VIFIRYLKNLNQIGKDKLFNKRKDDRRKSSSKSVRDKILIVCEGQKTEPQYFKSFPVNKEIVEVMIPDTGGYNTDSLVKKAIELMEEDKKQNKEYNQVWCVFDRDYFPAQNFNNAFILAERNQIRIAYSNEAFEVWYLLHFHYYQDACPRKEYEKRLTELLKKDYRKNDPKMYTLLESKQKEAIRNAQNLLKFHKEHSHDRENHPEKDNPSTTVFKFS
jgi:hypothetical protein